MTIEVLWDLVKENEGNVFFTLRGLDFRYEFHGDYIVVNRAKTAKLYRTSFEKALSINYKCPTDLERAGIYGQSYVYSIIETLKKGKSETNRDDSTTKIEQDSDKAVVIPEAQVVPQKKKTFGRWLLEGFVAYMARTRVYSVTTVGRNSHGKRYINRRYKIVHRVF